MMKQNAIKNGSEFEALKEASALIGQDPMLIQAAGGNTSLKDADVMWIKASGTLLSDAETSDIFVPVDLPEMQKSLAKKEARADLPAEFLLPGGSDLRPSIETSLHAVFPHKVVMHAHCIHTLVHAVQVDCETLLAPKLEGLNWEIVSYAKPGANLARLVKTKMANNPDVIILRNHGVIVAGETVGEVRELLLDVHRRLAIPACEDQTPSLENLAGLLPGSDFELPKDRQLHQLALDIERLQQIAKGSLYPDHVIFCGIGVSVLLDKETPEQAETRIVANGASPPVFLIVPGCGVIVQKTASSGAHALMRCLLDVAMRLPKKAQLNYLSLEQNLELLDWDAEKYRQTLDAK